MSLKGHLPVMAKVVLGPADGDSLPPFVAELGRRSSIALEQAMLGNGSGRLCMISQSRWKSVRCVFWALCGRNKAISGAVARGYLSSSKPTSYRSRLAPNMAVG